MFDELVNDINSKITELDELACELNGKATVIPGGKYAGRLGEISNCHFSGGRVIAILKPYRIREYGVLSSDIDARVFRDVSTFGEIFDNVTDEDIISHAGGNQSRSAKPR